MPKGTLAHLLVEKGTYDDGDYVYDGEDEHWDSWEAESFRFLDKSSILGISWEENVK